MASKQIPARQKDLNVFIGEDSMVQYYNPEFHPHLPLVEIPRKLNPLRDDGVRIYAKMMTFLPAHNVKALPALNMLQTESNLVTPETKTIVEYSSGSTVISMATLARVLHNINDVHAFLSNKTAGAKLRLMQFFGLNITLFGGPSQPEPLDKRGGIQRAMSIGKERSDAVNPNQYENTKNYEAHMRWTGPQLLEQMPYLDVFAAGLGTSGTMTGTGRYLKQQKPSITSVGVCTAPGDRVPGPRSVALLEPVEFPWREAIDTIEEVGSHDSFRLSMELSREGIVCGPSSGFNLTGLLSFLGKKKKDGTLHELSTRSDGEVHCAFICCDLPYQYIDEYFSHLGQEAFPEIKNKNLLGVDKYRYDDRWELSPSEFVKTTYQIENDIFDYFDIDGNISDAFVFDLRRPEDFAKRQLPGAFNLGIDSLSADQPSPFSDPLLLERQWLELDGTLKLAPALCKTKKRVAVVDYQGDTARIATSILRAHGLDAWFLKGGMDGLADGDLESKLQRPVIKHVDSGIQMEA